IRVGNIDLGTEAGLVWPEQCSQLLVAQLEARHQTQKQFDVIGSSSPTTWGHAGRAGSVVDIFGDNGHLPSVIHLLQFCRMSIGSRSTVVLEAIQQRVLVVSVHGESSLSPSATTMEYAPPRAGIPVVPAFAGNALAWADVRDRGPTATSGIFVAKLDRPDCPDARRSPRSHANPGFAQVCRRRSRAWGPLLVPAANEPS